MPETPDRPSRPRRIPPAVTALVAGILIGAGAVWSTHRDDPRFVTITGTTISVNGPGTAIGLRIDGADSLEDEGMGFAIGTAAAWAPCADCDLRETDGRPECVVPLSSGQRLQLVVMNPRWGGPIAPDDVAGRADVVLSVRCLSEPTTLPPPDVVPAS